MTILIISDISDLQVYWVTHFLNKWGINHQIFSPAEYPLKITQSTHLSSISPDCDQWVLENGNIIDPSKIKSVWYRKPALPQLPNDLKDYEREYALNECRQSLYGLYNSLDHAFWISSIHNLRISSNKPLQLRMAISLGFLIPETLITNEPKQAIEFAERFNGNIIYKTLSDGILYTREGPWEEPRVHGEIYATFLSGIDPKVFGAVRNTPCLFQEYIKKDYELRVTVVHDKVFAVEIHSQDCSRAKIDWRKANIQDVPHKLHKLPRNIREKCLALVKGLGLEFGAIDLIRRHDGEYVFLEINPNGQYGWLEDTIGTQISEYIAKVLAGKTEKYV
ncbi:MvdC/MvdD family ATP grasp protein [Desulfobacter hydrogenophilus]|nr:hypothetical protein [Desulfobacter hydrogenophilus]NDY71225.1 hypothetical protein [Desulfobacter hydrogenophilus]